MVNLDQQSGESHYKVWIARQRLLRGVFSYKMRVDESSKKAGPCLANKEKSTIRGFSHSHGPNLSSRIT